jgi:sporulation protein YlmC with PRC-barrel domain
VARLRHDIPYVMERTMKFPNSNPFRRSLLAGAVAAGLALSMGHAAAQSGDNRAAKSSNEAKQSTETKRAEKDARKNWEQTHRASKIIGSEVRNAQNKKVGEVKDLVLADPSSGTISHVVVSVGGVAGMGDKLFAVPFDQIEQASAGRDYLVLSGSSDLSKGFDEKSWPTDGMAWREGSNGNRAAAAPATSSSPAVTPSASSATSPSTGTNAATGTGSTPGTSPAPSASTASAPSGTGAASSTPGTSLDTAATPATASPPPQ